MTIYATWCISNNIGDTLTTWLVNKISGELPIYVHQSSYYPKLVGCGSILNWANSSSIVWGAGIANRNDVICKCDVRAVRGPISAKRYQECTGERALSIADPAILCPLFFNPTVEKKYNMGIIPHYINQHEVVSSAIANREDVKIINVFDSLENIVTQIKQCSFILSSSLHGLVLANAYGVGAVWLKCYDTLGGDDTKFLDYFASVNLNMKPILWYSFLSGQDTKLNPIRVNSGLLEELQQKLMDAYPLTKKE